MQEKIDHGLWVMWNGAYCQIFRHANCQHANEYCCCCCYEYCLCCCVAGTVCRDRGPCYAHHRDYHGRCDHGRGLLRMRTYRVGRRQKKKKKKKKKKRRRRRRRKKRRRRWWRGWRKKCRGARRKTMKMYEICQSRALCHLCLHHAHDGPGPGPGPDRDRDPGHDGYYCR